MSGSGFTRKPWVKWQRSATLRAFRVLSNRDQKKLIGISIIQISLGALDLIGIIAIGLLGSLAVSGVQQKATNTATSQVLVFLHISDTSLQTQAVILGVGAVTILIGRTILSIVFTRRILFFMSSRAATISSNLIARLLSQSILVVQSRSTQENLYTLTTGVSIIMMQVLATITVLASDASLLIVMAVGLFFVDPATAAGSFLLFFFIGYFLYRFMHLRAGALGSLSSALSIKSNEKIVEVLSSYRESIVHNRTLHYAREIGNLIMNLYNNLAEMSFLPYVSKYVIETAVLLGALMISGIQFYLQDATQAVATLAIFLAAGTRIAPAVLRIQQGSITIRSSLGQATSTLNLIDFLGNSPIDEKSEDTLDLVHSGFIPEIQIQSISFTYPGKPTPAISNLSLDISPGTMVAIVGPSGAGKTTLIDILLGIVTADNGSVLISGLTPSQVAKKWSGAMSYVPQDVVVMSGTIRENISLGFPKEVATNSNVLQALEIANLQEFIELSPAGIDTQVGERGTKISGGQRQRLGIARAMFTQPKLLVLDEATSSLDAETEESISKAISNLRGMTTVLMVAHRLSTVRNADLVVYIDGGKILATGTFGEVRQLVPEFNNQATLMGL